MSIERTSYKWLIWILWMVLWATPTSAVETKSIRDDQYTQFKQGELQSMALSSDGSINPTYARRTIGDAGVEIIWDALREPNGSVICATGHHGALVRVIDENTSQTLATVEEPELTAMLELANGSILVAAAPSGRIYELHDDDTLTTYTQLDAHFVWRMVLDEQGMVWAATGTQGKLFRMRQNRGEVEVEEVFEFGSANLLDLWIDERGTMGRKGDLYIAAQDPGWLYRLDPKGGTVEVVYNAQAEEIRAIVPFEGGLALALNTERSPTSQALNLTLRMGGGRSGSSRSSAMPLDESATSGAEAPPEPSKALGKAFEAAKRSAYGSPRSEVVVLSPEGFIRQLWTAPERPIHSLALSPIDGLMVAAGGEGRLFEIQSNGDFSVICDLKEDYLVRIVPDPEGYLLTAARNGVLFDLKRERAKQSVYLSRPLDAKLPVRWGRFHGHGKLDKPHKATVAFRMGNDGDPDSERWSKWTKEAVIDNDQPLALPSMTARFLQYRLTLKNDAKGNDLARLDDVEAFFKEPNGAPRILKLTTAMKGSKKGGRLSGAKNGSSKGSGGGKSTPPGGGGKPNSGGSKGAKASSVGRAAHSNTMNLTASWKASDPNGDPLRFSLFFRAKDEQAWKLIDDELSGTQVPINISGVADGRYRFRLVASDKLSNLPGEGLSADKISDEVVIDNTPPRIEKASAKTDGTRAIIELNLTDDLSLIASVKVDIDNGDAFPLMPEDGLLDQRRELIRWRTPVQKPGEHVATFSATDRRGNTAIAKVVFTTQ